MSSKDRPAQMDKLTYDQPTNTEKSGKIEVGLGKAKEIANKPVKQ